jgi:sugar phosphate isomerase/epimerase
MPSRSINQGQTRRELLAAGVATAGILATSRLALAELAGGMEPQGDYGPFKMGLQSYSLRGYTTRGKADLKRALSVTRDLGLHYWESYTAHVPMTNDREKVKAIKDQIEAAGIQINGYGVVHLNNNEAGNRGIFDFAKTLGVSYLSVDPTPDSFDLLDKLVEEYGIPIGIHNHGPGHKYAMIDTIAQAIENHSPKIGCCIDTGHILRSKEDPVRAVEVFGNRVYGVHLKDVKNAETFTILGQGDLRTVDLLKALAANKYSYCLAIEYEEKPENPFDDIKACLAQAQKAIAAVSG